MVKRSSFAKIGVIMLALVAGFGLMGMGVSYWSESLNIAGTVEIGSFAAQLSSGDCYTDSPNAVDTSISSNVADNVLEVTVTNAQVSVQYYCDFNIANLGTIPLKIQSIVVSTVPEGVVVGITGVAEDQQIDPGETATGTVEVDIPTGYTEPDPLVFTVTIDVVQWNQ